MRRHVRALLAVAALATLWAFGTGKAFAAYNISGSFAGGGPGPGGSGSADGFLSNPGQADVNSETGKLYVADTGNDRVQVFAPTLTAAEYDSKLAVASPAGLAIDQSTGDVYVSTATGIEKYTANRPRAGPIPKSPVPLPSTRQPVTCWSPTRART